MSKRSGRNYTIDKENGLFIKTYPLDNLSDDNLEKEFKKGIILSQIINYPRPIKKEGNSIYYDYLDIKCSLFDLLVGNKSFDLGCFKTIGEYLRKMHDANIIHGDFSPINVVFTRSNNIYFIDASFSRHNTQGKVLMEADNIYHDISLLFTHLKISKPLFKPWKFFQFEKFKKAKQFFLKGYLQKESGYDEKENLKQEIKFMENYVRFHKLERMDAKRIIRIIILKINIWLNKLFLRKKEI